MRRIGVYCDRGVENGMKMLTEELRKEGIPESHVINVGVNREALYYYAFIQEVK